MKNLNLSFLFFAIAMLFSINISATATNAPASDETTCNWDSWFEYPRNNEHIYEGKDVYVKVKPRYKDHIAYMELHVNGKFIRKESSYPFEWCRPNSYGDDYLRKLKPGTYKIKVVIKDRCGYRHEKYCVVYVKPHRNNCHFNNPLVDLDWLKKLKYKYPDFAICEYKVYGKKVFRIYKPNSHNCMEYWYNCYGELICKFISGHQPHHTVKHAIIVKCWYKCGGHNPHACNYKFWFKSPIDKKYYEAGKDLYVKVDVDRKQDIEYMELYVNGKPVRKESSYPYEWGRPNQNNDHYLRNLRPGTYKIVVKVKDRCGKYYEKYCVIYVKQQHPNYCNIKYWFKYPTLNKKYYEGEDIYVKLDIDNYREVEYVNLYVNGRFVRKESNAPYEWGRPRSSGDYLLRKCKPGTYKILCKIKDRCGKIHEKYCIIVVKRRHS